MQIYQIIFKDEKSKERFIKRSNTKDYSIDIKYGTNTYDGKSVIGITSLPKNTPFKAMFNTNSWDVTTDFREWIIFED